MHAVQAETVSLGTSPDYRIEDADIRRCVAGGWTRLVFVRRGIVRSRERVYRLEKL